MSNPKTKLRWVLRALAAGLGAAALTTPPGWITTLVAALAAATGAVTVDLPRDPWPEQKRRR